jgi:hypothetical protein
MNDRLIYKMLMRSCIFNDVKHDKKVLFCVALLDFCTFCLAGGFSVCRSKHTNRRCGGRMADSFG